MPDPFNLSRFVTAQDCVLENVRAELAAGQKRSHWMWFVFPQIAGLGHSPMAREYAIGSLEEARAYLEHPVLGPRLVELTQLVTGSNGGTANQIFGSPDDLKFHSSMTLFSLADPTAGAFSAALAKFFGGGADLGTLELLDV
jgi:uncharacterized protein (DUF1810 family)